MLFKVDYSVEKDIWNHLNSLWRFTYLKHGRRGMSEKLLKPYPERYKQALKKAENQEEATKVIKKFLFSLPLNYRNTTLVIAKGVEAILEENRQDIISSLEGCYNKRFPFNKIFIYITTVNIYPYNYEKRWIMTGRNSSIEGHIRTVKHELNHFMFYYYFPKLKEELGKVKYERLKEALAIFTSSGKNDKPAAEKLENYFKKCKGTIPEILKRGDWKKYI
jgi:hypothetical protein